MFNTNGQCYQNISQVLLTSAFVLWPTCTRSFGIREKIWCGFRFFGVFLCGFAVFRPPLRPPHQGRNYVLQSKDLHYLQKNKWQLKFMSSHDWVTSQFSIVNVVLVWAAIHSCAIWILLSVLLKMLTSWAQRDKTLQETTVTFTANEKIA